MFFFTEMFIKMFVIWKSIYKSLFKKSPFPQDFLHSAEGISKFVQQTA